MTTNQMNITMKIRTMTSLQEQSILAQLFPLSMRFFSTYMPIQLQDLDSNWQPLAFCLEIATYSFTNEESEECCALCYQIKTSFF